MFDAFADLTFGEWCAVLGICFVVAAFAVFGPPLADVLINTVAPDPLSAFHHH